MVKNKDTLRKRIEHNSYETIMSCDRYNKLKAIDNLKIIKNDPVYQKLSNCAILLNNYKSFQYKAYETQIVNLFVIKLQMITNRLMKEEEYNFYLDSSHKTIIKKIKDEYLEIRKND